MMRATWLLAGLMLASTALRAAEPASEPVDAAFLEYLGTLEGDDDNWTLLSEAGKPSAEATDDDQAASKDSVSKGTPSSKAKPGKPKEAAKPAAEER